MINVLINVCSVLFCSVTEEEQVYAWAQGCYRQVFISSIQMLNVCS